MFNRRSEAGSLWEASPLTLLTDVQLSSSAFPQHKEAVFEWKALSAELIVILTQPESKGRLESKPCLSTDIWAAPYKDHQLKCGGSGSNLPHGDTDTALNHMNRAASHEKLLA